MASIRKEITTNANADQVWAALRDIGALHTRLVPGFVVDTRPEPGARIVTFGNGMVVREPIVDVDDGARRIVWSAESDKLTHYNASAQVFAGDNGRTKVVWIADVLPNDALQFVLITDLYEGGDANSMLARVASIKQSGVNIIVLLALFRFRRSRLRSQTCRSHRWLWVSGVRLHSGSIFLNDGARAHWKRFTELGSWSRYRSHPRILSSDSVTNLLPYLRFKLCAMGVSVELHNTGNPADQAEIVAAIEHVLAESPGDWRIAILGSQANDRWEMKIKGPNGFERSYTLEGSAGEH